MALQTKTYTYGGTDQSASRYYKTVLTLTEGSTDISGNYSTIHYSLVIYAGNTQISNYRTGARIILNGTECAHRDGSLYSNQLTLSAWGQATLLEGSVNVPHNADGTLQMSVSFEVYHPFTPDSYAPGNFTYSGGTMDLTRIPRHSVVADASGDIGKTVTLTVTRQSTDFYHSLRYRHPASGAYYYIDAGGNSVAEETLLSATSVPFHIPLSFADGLGGMCSGSVTVECWTYTANDKTQWLQESKNATVTFLPQPSTVADTAGVIGETAYLAISRQSTDFNHSLRYKHPVSGTYYYIDTDGNSVETEILHSGASVPFKVPDLYSVIPNSTSGELEIECWTFPANDISVYLWNHTTTTFTFRTDESACQPAVSATLEDTNATAVAITGDSGVLIRYVSAPRVTVTAQAKNSAQITQVLLWYKEAWRDSQDGTFLLEGVEQDAFTVYAEDTRGYSKLGGASAKAFVPYVPLTNNAYTKRTNQTGSSATLFFTGKYYPGNLHNAQNILRLWYKLRGQDDWTEVQEGAEGVTWDIDAENETYTVAVVFNDLDYTSNVSIETRARDLLGETNNGYDLYKTVTIPAGVPVFAWGKNAFKFNVPVELPSLKVDGAQVDLVIASGTWGDWEYRKWSSGTAECWKSKTAAVTCDQPWESLYYGTVSQEQFPAGLFVQTPVLTVTLEHRNVFFSKAAATKDGTGELFALSAVRITEAEPCTLQYTARGKWK